MFTTLILSVLLADAPPTAAAAYYRPSGPVYESHEAFRNNARDLIRNGSVRRYAAKELEGHFDLSTQERWEQFLKRHVTVQAVGTGLLLIQARELPPAKGALVVNAAAEGFRLCVLEYSQRTDASKEYHVRNLRETVNKAERKLKTYRDELAERRARPHQDEANQRSIAHLERRVADEIKSADYDRDRLHRMEMELEQWRRKPDAPIVRVLRWAPGDSTQRPAP